MRPASLTLLTIGVLLVVAPLSVAQTGPSPGAASKPAGAASGTPNYNQSMDRLMQAAQKLREANQTMATQPAGPQRDQAIRQANDALLETNQAMISLPPELRFTQRSGPIDSKAMDRLMQAAQKLREAAQAMAAQPAGTQRSQAIRQVNDALLETQQAMVALLPDA